MVSRIRRSPATVLPSWLTEFNEGAWATRGGFDGWRESVREWCHAHDLRRLDLESWLAVFANVSMTSHRRSGWGETRPDVSTALPVLASVSEESEAL